VSKTPVVLHATFDEHGVELEDAEPDYVAEFDADDAQTRPCAYCGRPVPQRASAGRPFRYCRDNDDECLRAARNARMRQRNAPGLAGQVAQAFELADRLEKAVESGDAETIDAEHRALVSTIDKAAEHGALHRNNAARKKSRVARISQKITA